MIAEVVKDVLEDETGDEVVVGVARVAEVELDVLEDEAPPVAETH